MKSCEYGPLPSRKHYTWLPWEGLPETIDIERKNRLLKVCFMPATSATFLAFFSFFLAVAINRTNLANKTGGTCHLAVYIT